MLIENQITKAISNPRQDTLKLKLKGKLNCVPLATTLNNTLPPLEHILKVNLNLKDIFQEPSILTNGRANNLREMMESNNTLNNKVIHLKSAIKSSR